MRAKLESIGERQTSAGKPFLLAKVDGRSVSIFESKDIEEARSNIGKEISFENKIQGNFENIFNINSKAPKGKPAAGADPALLAMLKDIAFSLKEIAAALKEG